MSNKNYKRRSKERVSEIDDFLSEWYEKEGPAYCAEKLGEEKNYIFTRAHALNIRYENVDKYKSKSTRKTSKVDRLENRVQELMNINARLRKENMKIIHENVKLKKAVESDSRFIRI